MLRFTHLQVTILTTMVFFLSFGSFRLYSQRVEQRTLQQDLLTQGFEILPESVGDDSGSAQAPIDKLEGQALLEIREQMKININTADVEQLTSLPGVGPGTAQKIIDYRKENGPFQSIDGLTEVPRIGEKALAKFRDQITVGHPEDAPAASAETAEAGAPEGGAEGVVALDTMESAEPGQEGGSQQHHRAPKEKLTGPIDINTASQSEIEKLPRVGPSMAKAILEYRTKHGSFKSAKELMNVPRIGAKTLEKMLPYITINGQAAGPVPAESGGSGRSGGSSRTPRAGSGGSSSRRELAAGQKVNINTASESELTALPGVGPSTAQKIVEHRAVNGPFRSIEDLQKVKGIGPAKFAKMKDYLAI